MSVEKARMISGRFPLWFFFVLLIQFQFYAFQLAYTSALPAIASSSETNLSYILQDVLTTISASEKWKLKDVRVSKFDVGKVRFGTSHNYEFHIRLGKKQLTLQTLEEFGSWSKFRKPKSDLGSLIHQVTSLAVLDTLEVEGPLELRADALHQLSLSLPMNISYTGLKHILVGEGITLEVRRAQEVSFFHSSDLDLPMNRGAMFSKWKSEIWPFLQSTCMTLIPIHISGTASLAAYSARNPGLYIETTFISEDTIMLLPERSYHGSDMHRKWSCPFDALSLRLSMLEKILRSLLGRRVLRNQLLVSIEAKTKVSVAVKFPIELERDVRSSKVTVKGGWLKWARPITERVWFEIVARVESDRLKPLSIEKLKHLDFWNILKPNKSFSKLGLLIRKGLV